MAKQVVRALIQFLLVFGCAFACIAMASSFLLGCSPTKPRAQREGEVIKTQSTPIDGEDSLDVSALKMAINGQRDFPAYLKPFAELIAAGKPISFKGLSQLWIDRQRDQFFKSEEPRRDRPFVGDRAGYVERNILMLAQQMDPQKTPFENKKSVEAALEKSGKNLIFNPMNANVLSILYDRKLQAYSGTVLQQWLYRTFGAATFHQQQFVIIFEPGHVMPGFLRDGKLTGIEPVVSGSGVKEFGEIGKINLPLRIVDADLFAVIEIFKDYLDNTSDVVANALALTAQARNLPSFEKQVHEAAADVPSGQMLSQFYRRGLGRGRDGAVPLGTSPFAFGSPAVFQGDRPRLAAEQLRPEFSSETLWTEPEKIIQK